MRALPLVLAAAAASGCLSPDKPLFNEMDTTRPSILQIEPPLGDLYGGDGGVPSFSGGVIFTVHFSEPMDVSSLRPGIAVRDMNKVEQPLDLYVAPAYLAAPLTQADLDVDWPVEVSSPSGFVPGVYQLILRELLIDAQGNPLQVPAADGGFSDNGYVATFQVM